MRGGVVSKMSFEFMYYAVPRDMQVADSVSTAGPRADFTLRTVVPTRFAGIRARGTLGEQTSSRTESFGCAKRHLLSRCSHLVAVANEVQVR